MFNKCFMNEWINDIYDRFQCPVWLKEGKRSNGQINHTIQKQGAERSNFIWIKLWTHYMLTKLSFISSLTSPLSILRAISDALFDCFQLPSSLTSAHRLYPIFLKCMVGPSFGSWLQGWQLRQQMPKPSPLQSQGDRWAWVRISAQGEGKE